MKRVVHEIIAAVLVMAIGIVLFLLSSSQIEQPNRAFLDQQFTLEYQESILIEELQLTFAAVGQDSRCPSDVLCIQTGDITVALSLKKAGNKVGDFPITLGAGEPGSVQVDENIIELIQVDPYPISTKQLFPMDYRITLVVR